MFALKQSTIFRSSLRHLSTAQPTLFDKILIANRGEIACRIQRTAKQMGIQTVAVYSEADRHAQHVLMADEAYLLGPSAAAESYLLGDKILEIAKQTGAQAIHPGYGFLSENAQFARACAESNIEFIGPPVEAIEAMGSKSASKNIMIEAGVPVTPGYHGKDQSFETLCSEARKIGYPVMLKAVLGGGGKGMRIVDAEKDLKDALEACKREAQASFGDDRVLVEKYLRRPRHIELQVFADKFGHTIHLFERDCSVQRRHQKVLEEAPAPGMHEALRKKMGDAAVAAAKAVGYVGAGTVEFMLDEDDSFYFMEMNTRLQVEHPVTEMITKQDLVEMQLKAAAGHKLSIFQEDLDIHGHAIEARVYAENPYNNFLPGTGQLHYLKVPDFSEDVRVDTGVIQNDLVSVFYDPMIAKLIAKGPNREVALHTLIKALHKFEIVGLTTNIEFLIRAASHEEYQKGGVNTSFLDVYGEELTKPYESVPKHAVVIGALSLLLHEKNAMESSSASLWQQKDLNLFGYRSNDELIRQLKFKDQDRDLSVRVTYNKDSSFNVSLDDEDISMRAVGTLTTDGQYDIRLDNRNYTGTVVFQPKGLHLFCNDHTTRYKYDIEIPQPSYEAASLQSSHRAITAPMPGKIIKLLVKEGDKVMADEPLVIMEAMKMEHVIRSTTEGVIGEMFYEENDFVEDGKVLIELN